MSAQRLEPKFSFLVEGLLGAEGPVFDISANFYMVAPEVETDNKPAGQVLKIDLASKTVQYRSLFEILHSL